VSPRSNLVFCYNLKELEPIFIISGTQIPKKIIANKRIHNFPPHLSFVARLPRIHYQPNTHVGVVHALLLPGRLSTGPLSVSSFSGLRSFQFLLGHSFSNFCYEDTVLCIQIVPLEAELFFIVELHRLILLSGSRAARLLLN